MTPERNKELAELLPVHVMRLANTNMGLSLMDWNEISNDILDAARLLGALAPPTDDEVQAINRRHEHCCHTVTNADWKEREAFQAHDDRAALLRMLDAERANYKSVSGAAQNVIDGLNSELSAERARRVELEAALKQCQSTLEILIDPTNKGAGISNMAAWASCVSSESRARAALKEPGQ